MPGTPYNPAETYPAAAQLITALMALSHGRLRDGLDAIERAGVLVEILIAREGENVGQ